MPPRHLYSLLLLFLVVSGRVCRLWNVLTPRSAPVCRVEGGMFAACDLTPAGASTIYSCDMHLGAVSSRAPAFILHTFLIRLSCLVGSGWSVFLRSLYSFSQLITAVTFSFTPSHSLHSLSSGQRHSTRNVLNNPSERLGVLHAPHRPSTGSMPCADDMAGSSAIKIQPINTRKPHRLQHLITAERKRIQLPL